MNHRPPKRIDLGFGDAPAAVAERKPSKRPRLQAAAATAGTITDLSTGKSKVVVKTAHERVRGEKAVDGAKLSASKKRREKKKKAKAARVAAKATGEIPAKPTNVAILYLREWAAAKATTKQKTSDVVTKTHEWKFQKVRQTWLLKHMFNPGVVEKPDFKILLQYLKGLQGKARAETVAAAQEHANDLADVGDEEGNAFNRIKKKRAEKMIKELSK